MWVVQLPEGKDPDLLLRLKGAAFFQECLKKPLDYLTFLVQKFSRTIRIDTPAGKHQLAEQLIQQIRSWGRPVLVHESLQKLADLLKLPPHVIQGSSMPQVTFHHQGRIQQDYVDADKILETDLLRLLFLSGQLAPKLIDVARRNVLPETLKIPTCRRLYELALAGNADLLSCAGGLEKEDEGALVAEMMQRKINLDKAEALLQSTLKRILERNWLEERERIKLALHSGSLSEDEAYALAKQFDALKRQVPQVT